MYLHFLSFIGKTRLFARTVLLSALLVPCISVAAQTPPDHNARGLLFEISSGGNTAYLFGSIHLAKADFYPLSPAVQGAYQQAGTVAVEADVSNAEAGRNAQPLMRYVAPDKLQAHLSKATWQRLESVAGSSLGQFQDFKAAVVAMGLTLGAFAGQGYDPAYGIDLHFITRAKADKKNLIELESIAFQASVLAGLSDEEGDALLRQTLDAFGNGEALDEANSMIAMWKSGDAAGLATLFEHAANKDAGSKKLMKLLLDDRNPGMTQKITRLLAQASKAFIVVGAGHLTGTNSIIDLLQKQGVQVRQIP